jgi:EAL domain-containing protein (putative c-di-GMP-specific phosphodiesterase class I)
LEESRILLASQPVVQQHEGQQHIVHEEIFLRYKDKEGTVHNAGFFIPVATSLGIVDILDRYMIEKVLERLSNGSLRTSVALNLSAEFVKKYDNIEWLKEKLEIFHRVHKTLLWFEVSNLIALNDLEAVRAVCKIVKSFGCKFGIDHFVLPASGAAYLQVIRPDYVKSNSAYLKDILGDRQSGEARESLMNVVTSLGISMIAMAIEDSEQIARCSEHGIEHLQGSAIAPVRLL